MKVLKGHFPGPVFYTCQLQAVAVSTTIYLIFSITKLAIEHIMKPSLLYDTCNLNGIMFFVVPLNKQSSLYVEKYKIRLIILI